MKSAVKQSNNNGWKKGQSGNPHGRPRREICIPDILRRIGDEPSSTNSKITKLEALMRRIFCKADQGEPWACQFIADRTEGRVTEHLEILDTTPHKVVFTEIKVRTIPRSE